MSSESDRTSVSSFTHGEAVAFPMAACMKRTFFVYSPVCHRLSLTVDPMTVLVSHKSLLNVGAALNPHFGAESSGSCSVEG